MSSDENTVPLLRKQHIELCVRCLRGLGPNSLEADTARTAIAFYCLSTLDLLSALESRIDVDERNDWREWLWKQQISGDLGSGFRPGTSAAVVPPGDVVYDQPNLIMTYTAMLSLCILRDDLTRLDRKGIIKLLRNAQREDGSFTPVPNWGESDVRTVYCAFVISSMLSDWSGVNVQKALGFINRCRSYEGGYGQAPGQEAQGGTTYCALASMTLASFEYSPALSPPELDETLRWLAQRQVRGFQGRTEKVEDACYSFWCGASLEILGAGELVDNSANAAFISKCQFKFGGIAKFPDEHPDPYHTYLGLASVAIFPSVGAHESWSLAKLDPLVNATEGTARWMIEKLQ